MVTVTIVVFWNVTPWRPTDKHRRFGIECLQQYSGWKIREAGFSEYSRIEQIKDHHYSEDSTLSVIVSFTVSSVNWPFL